MTILTPRFLVTVSVMFLSVMCKEASEKTEEMKSSEEPDFTGILQSDEKRTGYYNFVSENGSDIYINVKFKLKQKRAEISDIDKRKATVNLSAKEPGKDAEEEILKLFCDILNIKREQLSFEEGGTDRERTIKLINPQITRYKILFKIIEAWEYPYILYGGKKTLLKPAAKFWEYYLNEPESIKYSGLDSASHANGGEGPSVHPVKYANNEEKVKRPMYSSDSEKSIATNIKYSIGSLDDTKYSDSVKSSSVDDTTYSSDVKSSIVDDTTYSSDVKSSSVDDTTYSSDVESSIVDVTTSDSGNTTEDLFKYSDSKYSSSDESSSTLEIEKKFKARLNKLLGKSANKLDL